MKLDTADLLGGSDRGFDATERLGGKECEGREGEGEVRRRGDEIEGNTPTRRLDGYEYRAARRQEEKEGAMAGNKSDDELMERCHRSFETV
jgi:hypothetical protein